VFERAPDLLRRVADQVVKVKLESELGPRLLALAESQLADVKPWKLAEMNRVAARLQKLGFNVVRIPYAAAPAQGSTWPGVGYANMLVHERKLFVPSLGLGEFETRLYENLGKKLRNRYEVIPVDARSGLVGNGGVHCVFGIVREPVQVEKPTH
jgi:agmatine/peptidylarginine deiminase